MMKERIAILKEKLAGGVSPAMVTPLKSGSYCVDIDAIAGLVEFLIDKGVKGLFAGGTTGEGVALDRAERTKLHEATIAAANGRVPVLVHVGAMRIDTAVDLARHAAAVNADAIVAVTPYFYGMHDDGLAAYYEAIAAAAPDVPLFAYDIPHLAVNGISPMLASRLANIIPSLAGFKSSNVDVQVVRRLIDASPENCIFLAGNESAALGSLALGADGLISGLSTAVPEPFVALTQSFASGNMAAARAHQKLINKLLLEIPAGARLGAIKSILNARSIPVGQTGPTLPYPDQEIWPAMHNLMKNEAVAF